MDEETERSNNTQGHTARDETDVAKVCGTQKTGTLTTEPLLLLTMPDACCQG